MEQDTTTEGITRADVDEAMAHLGIHNPKPGIPLETTVSGHEIVALSRRIGRIEEDLVAIKAALGLVD